MVELVRTKIIEKCVEKTHGFNQITLVFPVGIVSLPLGNRDAQTFEIDGDFEVELRHIRKGSNVIVGIENHKVVSLGI